MSAAKNTSTSTRNTNRKNKLSPAQEKAAIDAHVAAQPTTTPEVIKAARKEPAPVTPWVDLPAYPALQKAPREKTTIAVALAETSKEGGATLAEIKEALKAIEMGSHDPKQLLTWMSKNRGWGFRMEQATGKISLVRA